MSYTINTSFRLSFWPGLFLLLIGFMACDSTGSSGEDPALSLTLRANSIPGSTQGKGVSAMQNNHVTFSEVKLLLRNVKFKRDVEDDGLDDDSLDFKTGTFVVNLNLSGAANRIGVRNVPSAMYDEIEFEVHKPEDTETPPDPDFKTGNSGDERFSLIVRGTYEGEPFLYRSRETMRQDIEFSPPLEIAPNSGQIHVALTVDMSGWFVDEDGNLLNPADESNRTEIDASIKRSFEAFRDEDEDGERD